MTHLAFPNASPWFYDQYGKDAAQPDYSYPGSPAGLIRVDHILGTHIYAKAFGKGPVVFGASEWLMHMRPAVPSLMELFAQSRVCMQQRPSVALCSSLGTLKDCEGWPSLSFIAFGWCADYSRGGRLL